VNLREYAKGRPCLLRVPNYCAPGPENETVVLCHIKRGWFGSLKPPDIVAVWGCRACHDVIDGRQVTLLTREAIDSIILRALCEQLCTYDREGILTW
jgi:Protein of unknown function (DUF1364)